MSKSSLSKFVVSKLESFRADNRGQIGLIFGFSILPLLGLVGYAVDYGRGNSALATMNAAADAAALNALVKARNTHIPPVTEDVQKYFNGVVGYNNGMVLQNFATSTTKTPAGGMAMQVSYSATVPTTFMQMFGTKTMTISGSTRAEVDLPPFIDFYIMLDNSSSMGLAASAADISKLTSLTPDGCQFACHQVDANGNDMPNDYFSIAKNAGVQLRIDLLRKATQELLDSAANSATIPNEYRFGIYTFADNFKTIAKMGTDLATEKSLANAITMTTVSSDNPINLNTDYYVAFQLMNQLVPQAQDGSAKDKPKEFVFLITDGIENDISRAFQYCPNTSALVLDYNGNYNCREPNYPHSVSTSQTDPADKHVIAPFDATYCDTLKQKGVTVGVLYTPYLPLDGNYTYDTWVKQPVEGGTSANNLKNCASAGYYYTIGSDGEISSAMSAMFQKAINSARLTPPSS